MIKTKIQEITDTTELTERQRDYIIQRMADAVAWTRLSRIREMIEDKEVWLHFSDLIIKDTNYSTRFSTIEEFRDIKDKIADDMKQSADWYLAQDAAFTELYLCANIDESIEEIQRGYIK